MAHQTNIIGRTSELVAMTKLMKHGFTVLEPQTEESFDSVIMPPNSNLFLKAQTKTIFVREDKGGAMVVFSKKGDGTPYTKDEADVIIGVLNHEHVFVIPNTGQKEYWAQNMTIAKKKWDMLV